MDCLNQISYVGSVLCLLLCAKIAVGQDVSESVYPVSQVEEIGSNVMLNCNINGSSLTSDNSNITWYYDAVNQTGITIGGNGSQLILRNIQVADAGNYTCCSLQGSCSVVKLEVGLPPQKVEHLTCFSRNPDYGYCKWNVSKTDRLLQTTYTLQRRKKSKDGWVDVGSPENPTELRIAADHVYSLDSSNIDGEGTKDNGGSYKYCVLSTNALGSETTKTTKKFSIYMDAVPLPPQSVSVSAQTYHSLLVNWIVPPGFEEGFICKNWLGYRLRYNSSSSPEWTRTKEFNQETMNNICNPAYKLELDSPPYSKVCVQIQSRNVMIRHGKWNHEWSEMKCTRLLEKVPDEAPGYFRAEKHHHRSNISLINANLTWKPLPEVVTKYGRLVGYNITVSGFLDDVLMNTTNHVVSSNKTGLYLSGLNRSYRYTIKIVAFNGAGTSPSAADKIDASPIIAYKEAPGDFKANTTKHHKNGLMDVRLTWMPVPAEWKYGTLLGYNVTVTGYHNSRFMNKQNFVVPSDETSLNLSGLKGTYKYKFDIKAFNKVGSSPNASDIVVPSVKTEQTNYKLIAAAALVPITITVISVLVWFLWKKYSRMPQYNVKLPSIVDTSNYYTNAIRTDFHVPEQEHFDDICIGHHYINHVKTNQYQYQNQKVAMNMYENFPFHHTARPAEFRSLLDSLPNNFNELMDERNRDEIELEYTLHNRSRGQSSNFESNGEENSQNAESDTCYHVMTPEGLSPVKETRFFSDNDSAQVDEAEATITEGTGLLCNDTQKDALHNENDGKEARRTAPSVYQQARKRRDTSEEINTYVRQSEIQNLLQGDNSCQKSTEKQAYISMSKFNDGGVENYVKNAQPLVVSSDDEGIDSNADTGSLSEDTSNEDILTSNDEDILTSNDDIYSTCGDDPVYIDNKGLTTSEDVPITNKKDTPCEVVLNSDNKDVLAHHKTDRQTANLTIDTKTPYISKCFLGLKLGNFASPQDSCHSDIIPSINGDKTLDSSVSFHRKVSRDDGYISNGTSPHSVGHSFFDV